MTISDVLKAIKKHWIVEIILFCVVMGAVAGETFTTTPVYSTSSKILAQYNYVSSSGEVTGTVQQSTNTSSPTKLYSDFAQSDDVLQAVIDNLGLHTTVSALRSSVSASVDTSSSIVYLYANDADPKQAVDIVNELARQLKNQADSMSDSGVSVTFTVIQAAVEPSVASSPNIKANLAIGFAAAVIIAVLGALICEMLSKDVNDVETVQSIVRDPVLASVPKTHDASKGIPEVIAKPRGRASEEIRRLIANVSFVAPKDLNQRNVIIVTSSNPREGKTTMSVNMAAAFAEKGKSVLLIDADVRHPSVASMLGLNSGIGLSSLLEGDVSASEAIQPYWKPYLHVLPSEERKTPSGVILGSEAMHQLIDQASERYDYVIVDTAPMTVANDAAVFAKQGGVLLLVVGQGVAKKSALREVVREFRVSRATVRGVVLNMVPVSKGNRSSYYYYEDNKDDNKDDASSKKSDKSRVKNSQK